MLAAVTLQILTCAGVLTFPASAMSASARDAGAQPWLLNSEGAAAAATACGGPFQPPCAATGECAKGLNVSAFFSGTCIPEEFLPAATAALEGLNAKHAPTDPAAQPRLDPEGTTPGPLPAERTTPAAAAPAPSRKKRPKNAAAAPPSPQRPPPATAPTTSRKKRPKNAAAAPPSPQRPPPAAAPTTSRKKRPAPAPATARAHTPGGVHKRKPRQERPPASFNPEGYVLIPAPAATEPAHAVPVPPENPSSRPTESADTTRPAHPAAGAAGKEQPGAGAKVRGPPSGEAPAAARGNVPSSVKVTPASEQGGDPGRAKFGGCGTPGQPCCVAVLDFLTTGYCYGAITCDTDSAFPTCVRQGDTCGGTQCGSTCVSPFAPAA